jgi:hypothetical protein
MSNTSSSDAGHRGAVRNPATDRRLKTNRHNPSLKMQNTRGEILHGGQGRVKNPGTDRRLKTNR